MVTMFARIMTITYPVSIENIDGTTSSKALQSSLLTQFNTILYSISRVKDTNVKEQAAAHGALELCFTVIIQPITQNTALIIPNMIHIKFSSKFRFIGLYWGKLYHTQLRKAIPRSLSVPTIQTVKGRVVFFRKEREKISTLKPLTVWIFAVAISPPKTGNRIKKSCPCFRLLHSNGKTVCTTSAAGGRLCGGSAPAPPTSPKEQNGMLRNRA